jgi:PhnB protein
VIKASLAPWLSVSNGITAIEFYRQAFGAREVYHLDDPGGGVVSRLEIDGGEFWISGSSEDSGPDHPVEPSVRMIWTVKDPDTAFARAITAGASVVFPVSEGHGWRVGRLVDPFGHHWEIGHQVEERSG